LRIAFGGIHTECSTYSQLTQTEADFTVRSGLEMVAQMRLRMPEDVEMVPLFHARSVPGGPVGAETHAAFKGRFLRELRAALPVDAVYLAMHGAMHVEGLDDAEGDWISAVRDLVGPDVPIAASYDLHGNVTQRIVDAIDIFAAYRTAPHIDVAETCNRALAMLVDLIANGTGYRVGWVPVPVLWPGERTSTEDEPARSLYAALPAHDARDGVADANLMVGYVWADTPRATACAIVTGTNPVAMEASARELAQGYWDARGDFSFGVTTGDLAFCLDLAERAITRPVILADSGDNPTGGGVGDRADVLAAVLDRGMEGAVFVGIADAPAALAAEAAGEGASVELTLGASLGSACPTVTRRARVLKLHRSGAGNDLEAVIEIAGNFVVLSQRRRPYHDLADFRRLGIEVVTARMLVVKSGYLSPELAPIANPALMALTDGAVNQDIPALKNRKRPRPSYPFQTGFGWTPRFRLSARG
jgi:microcystin degradation protein MlrC